MAKNDKPRPAETEKSLTASVEAIEKAVYDATHKNGKPIPIVVKGPRG